MDESSFWKNVAQLWSLSVFKLEIEKLKVYNHNVIIKKMVIFLKKYIEIFNLLLQLPLHGWKWKETEIKDKRKIM